MSIKQLCSLADVSRSGYYHYLSTEEDRQRRKRQDQEDFRRIVEAYQFRGYAKGARGIYMRLIHMNPSMVMNIKKIRRLMRKYGLKCPIRKANPYRRMAKALKTSYVASNLLNQEFETHSPRAVLLTDITYISNGKAPRCHLSAIIDACTKELLAWVLSESIEDKKLSLSLTWGTLHLSVQFCCLFFPRLGLVWKINIAQIDGKCEIGA